MYVIVRMLYIMFCVYCLYNYVNKFEARSLFSTSHLNAFDILSMLGLFLRNGSRLTKIVVYVYLIYLIYFVVIIHKGYVIVYMTIYTSNIITVIIK